MPSSNEDHHGEMIEQPLFTATSRWRRILPDARQRELGLERIREIRKRMNRSD